MGEAAEYYKDLAIKQRATKRTNAFIIEKKKELLNFHVLPPGFWEILERRTYETFYEAEKNKWEQENAGK